VNTPPSRPDPSGDPGPPGAEVTHRLSPETFGLPGDLLRGGWYSDAYFTHARQVLRAREMHTQVTLQVFQREQSVLGGIDEAIAILRAGAGEEGFAALRVEALHEGDEIAPLETVMTISGDYSSFVHLETVYLGALARRSLVMRRVRDVVAAAGKPVLFFGARHNHWLMQPGDGWAAHVAGAAGVSTEAQASWWGGRALGTVAHGLIAAFGGDTVAAARAFANEFAQDIDITVLVDFENDSAATALAVADALGPRLWGVRLDTAQDLVDLSLQRELGAAAPGGVSPELAELVRRTLDGAGHPDVRIVASGGFDAERIAAFEAVGAPVDVYGVGSALLCGQNDFTADVVRVDGRPCAKAGRGERPNPRLSRVA
jgi:nicotinate phosphoribosyltransferase